jgi:hypothetical protein
MTNMTKEELDHEYDRFMLRSAVIERDRKAKQKFTEAALFQVGAFIIAFYLVLLTGEFLYSDQEFGNIIYTGALIGIFNIIYFAINRNKMFYNRETFPPRDLSDAFRESYVKLETSKTGNDGLGS